MEAKGILSVGDSDVSDMPRRMRTKVLMVDDQPIIGEAIRHMLAAEEDVDFFFCDGGKGESNSDSSRFSDAGC